MAHQFTISYNTYTTIATLAKARGQSPEEIAMNLLQQQVDTEWEAACAQYDTLISSPKWQQMETEADGESAAGQGDFYANDDAFKKAFE